MKYLVTDKKIVDEEKYWVCWGCLGRWGEGGVWLSLTDEEHWVASIIVQTKGYGMEESTEERCEESKMKTRVNDI